MTFYERLGLTPLINASETYTGLGGSLMDPRTLKAMEEAGKGFVDMEKLLDAVCSRAAALTRNEAAFVTTGAAGGLILSAAACLAGRDKERLEALPRADSFERNEFLVFDGKFLDMIPYWRMTSLAGGRIRKVAPNTQAMVRAVNRRTAGICLFPSTLYEKDIPPCEEVIPALRGTGVPIVVDAAAQLPPKSNLWYYTKELGADLAVFSGGKHIRGPQSTGLILGREPLVGACRMAASPNPYLGRAFKTGKEELAGLITALEIFMEEDTREGFERQRAILENVREALERGAPGGLRLWMSETGRLGTCQPLLLAELPEGGSARACHAYARSLTPPVDIGVYPPELEAPGNRIFLNAYNLKPEEAPLAAKAVLGYLEAMRSQN